MEKVGCPLDCDPSGDHVVLVGRDRFHDLPGEFPVVRCGGCGLLRTSPRPAASAIGAYYPDDYGPYRVSSQLPTRAGSPWRRRLRSFFEFHTQSLPPMAPGRMLEIGCASGSFLQQMAQHGWQVEGIEFSPDAAARARALGYEVHAGALETAPDPTESYDMVVGWMVLEHLHDPVLALQKLRRWTRPAGQLVLSVPNVDTLAFRLLKGAWHDLHLPNHLYHFAPTTLKQVLAAGGWRIENVIHQRSLMGLVPSAGHLLHDRGYHRLAGPLMRFPERPGRLPYLLYPVAWALSLLGQTGRMVIWARRDGD